MAEMKTVKRAIEFLTKKANSSVDVLHYKYRVFDEDFSVFLKTDKELINYANEQKEAIEEE